VQGSAGQSSEKRRFEFIDDKSQKYWEIQVHVPDIEDGDSVEVQGSAKDPYVLKNTDGVYSCTCPAWLHQSKVVEQRTCKHLRKYRGEQAEIERLGSLPDKANVSRRAKSTGAVGGSGGTDGGASGDTPGESDGDPRHRRCYVRTHGP
jgi:hypothetical protein